VRAGRALAVSDVLMVMGGMMSECLCGSLAPELEKRVRMGHVRATAKRRGHRHHRHDSHEPPPAAPWAARGDDRLAAQRGHHLDQSRVNGPQHHC
jgi:hypothetical protein